MATKTREVKGEIYVKCDTIDDLANEVDAMGYIDLVDFEEETGAVPEELVRKWWALINGRVHIR